MQTKKFQVQESTIQFFYEVDLYWKNYGHERTKLSKKLKRLYKGIFGRFISSNREAFLYKNPSGMLTYRLVKNMVSSQDYIDNVLQKSGFFREYYNLFCDYYFKVLNGNDIREIHEMYKDHEFPFLDDIYSRCL